MVEAPFEKGRYVEFHLFSGLNEFGGKEFKRLVQDLAEGNSKRCFQHYSDNSNRLSPQGKRVGRSGGKQSHAETGCNGVDLIGDAYQRAFDSRRNGPSGPAGQVMLVDGLCNRFRLVLEPCVGSPHYPLELGKFAHHARHQIGLAKSCSATNLGRVFRGNTLSQHQG